MINFDSESDACKTKAECERLLRIIDAEIGLNNSKHRALRKEAWNTLVRKGIQTLGEFNENSDKDFAAYLELTIPLDAAWIKTYKKMVSYYE